MGLFDRLKSKLRPAAPVVGPATADHVALAEQSRLDGNAALQAGRADQALVHYERFAALRPDHAPAHVNRGFALLTLRRLPQAEAAFVQAQRLAPDDHECAYCLAQCLDEQGRHADAAAQYQRSTALQPGFAPGWLALGLLCERMGSLGQAASHLRRCVHEDASLADGWQGLARIALANKDAATALAAAERWLALEPRAAHAIGMKADALRSLGRADEALLAADAALALAPDDPRLHLARGAALLALTRYADARPALERAVAAFPSHPEALMALGAALCNVNDFQRALVMLDRALAIDDSQADALHLRAQALAYLGRHDDAARFLEVAVGRRPDEARLQLGLALAWLSMGRWADGWRQYEWRWGQGASVGSAAPPPQALRWRPGGDVRGRRVLLQSEQGLGDAIQFLRYVPEVLARGAQVVLQLSPRLHGLIPDPWPGCRIVGEAPAAGEFDLHCPLMSLPQVLEMPEPLPMTAPYVHATADRHDHWIRRMQNVQGRRIGLVWAGNPKHADDGRRSIPLETLRQALQGMPHVQFVSLQMEIRDSDAAAREAWPELIHFGNEQQDMADTAALVESLDGVVSVDTSLVHLTGALKWPLWVLLSHHADWRWGLAREDTPWYPSARLLRQPQPGDWAAVLQRLRQELSDMPQPRT